MDIRIDSDAVVAKDGTHIFQVLARALPLNSAPVEKGHSIEEERAVMPVTADRRRREPPRELVADSTPLRAGQFRLAHADIAGQSMPATTRCRCAAPGSTGWGPARRRRPSCRTMPRCCRASTRRSPCWSGVTGRVAPLFVTAWKTAPTARWVLTRGRQSLPMVGAGSMAHPLGAAEERRAVEPLAPERALELAGEIGSEHVTDLDAAIRRPTLAAPPCLSTRATRGRVDTIMYPPRHA